MKPLRLAVIGAGHLGRIHARLLKQLEEVEDVQLVAIVDPVEANRTAVAAEFGAMPLASHEELYSLVDAAVLAAPTNLHYPLGIDLLNHGLHLLIEKPLAPNTEEADLLVKQAKAKRRVLQVGHVERFNPALAVVQPYVARPKFIEAARASTYTFRSIDVGVVLDLMIHDIDVVLSLVRSKVVQVQALGLAVFGPHEDIAHARLTFENGCVANLSASRCSFEPTRKMSIYAEAAYAQVDFGACQAKIVRPSEELLSRLFDVQGSSPELQADVRENLFSTYLPLEEIQVERGNAILDELTDFLTSIRSRRSPVVCGSQGRDAVAVAERVLAKIAAHRWTGAQEGPVGPLATPASSVLRGPEWAKVDEQTPAPAAPPVAPTPARRKAS
ncbi:Gfo/Idh/MocA family oxidoreductase [Lignipirellula cremea]|uniref:Dehydrogenase n=1 Tax=Lignipirellula cremea TaxID=2528010 RepID=A0A518DNG7_9BACT|nr:Gfo/Idh/MocA family oxidoreductase [Lignipirellula cremea]QDU93388.1 Dehydrogenase [Lignipirellula cremea]